jgi:murein DD-endopeptidase MepM/ murein hydrolase activator NlpD
LSGFSNFRRVFFLTLIVFGLILASGSLRFVLSGQAGDELADKLRKEIQNLETRIREGETGRRNTIDQLEDLDKKLELRRRLIVELERKEAVSNNRARELELQIQNIELEIERLSADLSQEEVGLANLKREASSRMIFFYKKMAGARLAILSGIDNLNDLAARRNYIRAIERFDHQLIEKLTIQRNLISHNRDQREVLRGKLAEEKARRLQEFDRCHMLIRDRKAEEQAQLKERAEKSSILKRIERDNDLMRAVLDERKNALEEIEREIARLEQNAPKATQEYKPGVPFKSLSGRLNPPLKRLQVTQPFGPSKHPKLGTVTINPGVDLRAETGESVQAAAGGVVTRIAWLRGFGNTIIVSHGDGYYTVYSRLEQVTVREGQTVQGGQPLGVVGDAGGSGGFHFEVWSKREKQDPMKWLGR